MTLPKDASPKRHDAIPKMLQQALTQWCDVVNATCAVGPESATRSVASILEIDLDATMNSWMTLVEHEDRLTCVRLNVQDRASHLPQLLRGLIYRLRLPAITAALCSVAARQHGELRRLQGYTPPMLVEESRILEVSIFNTIENNLTSVDFRHLLADVITITDECDSQLEQAMLGYIESVPTWPAA
jgi:hypothetical protein